VTTNLPEGRRGQAVALGLLIAAFGLFWAVLAAPLLGWYGARSDRLAERHIVLAHMARVSAALPSLRQAMAAVNASGPPSAALLEGNNDAIAGAALQGMVQDMATTAGATLASTEALPGEKQGKFRRIGLRVALSGTWPVLVAMLQAVEGSRVRLMVDDLQLHATVHASPAASKASSASIEASFVVLGFRPGQKVRPDLRADAGAQDR
jgi:general secretion pathway protein M